LKHNFEFKIVKYTLARNPRSEKLFTYLLRKNYIKAKMKIVYILFYSLAIHHDKWYIFLFSRFWAFTDTSYLCLGFLHIGGISYVVTCFVCKV